VVFSQDPSTSHPTKSYLQQISVCKLIRKHIVESVSGYQQTKAPREEIAPAASPKPWANLYRRRSMRGRIFLPLILEQRVERPLTSSSFMGTLMTISNLRSYRQAGQTPAEALSKFSTLSIERADSRRRGRWRDGRFTRWRKKTS
jgi:hypothetical protein